MIDFKISVLIVTKDRPHLLIKCLSSLKNQTVLPFQVVVVDNGHKKATKKIIKKIRADFKIHYSREKKQGEAFARNKALKLGKGNIFAFIDDDCIAERNWLANILNNFKKHSKIDGVIGISKNLYENNVYATVYQCYYLRWLMENFKNIKKRYFLKRNNNFFDTKNVAFKKKFRNFSFDTQTLFHSINIDVIVGAELLKKGKFIYDPKVIVYHHNPSSFIRLMRKNFFQGIADQLTLDKKNINLRRIPLKYSYFNWLRLCHKETSCLNFFQKIIFWMLLFIYPIPYKVGKLAYFFIKLYERYKKE